MSVIEFARNINAAMREMKFSGEDLLLVRNQRPVARITLETKRQTALQAMGDIYRTLDDPPKETVKFVRQHKRGARKGTLKELRNPWLP